MSARTQQHGQRAGHWLMCLIISLLVVGCSSAPFPPPPGTTPTTRAKPHQMVEPDDVLVVPLPEARSSKQGNGETFFDPHRTGVPLFDTKGLRNAPLGPWFRVGDFARTGNTTFRYARIDVRLVECLSRVRETTGEPMSILSAYRSWEHNEQIRASGTGAAKSSFHISGSAADVVTSTPAEQFAVAVYLECGCNTGLGISPRFYHVDIRDHEVIPWGYSSSQAGRLALARKVQRNVCGG